MRPKHFSCKCTTKRNPIFVNWSCNARSGGGDHRQCFFVQAFPIISQLSQLLRWRWRTLPIIYLPLMGSFILSRLYHISRKKRMFSFWNSFVTVLYFEWRHRWRQDLTDLVHPITQGNSLRASSPRGTEVGRGGGGVERNKCIAPQRPCIWGLPIKIL